MTDDAPDMIDASRRWPPASVWLAVLVLLGPPLGLVMYAEAVGGIGLQGLAAGLLMFGIAPSIGLFRGWPSGVTGAAWYGGVVLLLIGSRVVVFVDRVGVWGAVTAEAFVVPVWAVCLLAVLWWPGNPPLVRPPAAGGRQ